MTQHLTPSTRALSRTRTKAPADGILMWVAAVCLGLGVVALIVGRMG